MSNSLSQNGRRYQPDGFVGIELGRREMEIYLHLVEETMSVAEALTAQLRAIEIVAAHELVAAMNGRN